METVTKHQEARIHAILNNQDHPPFRLLERWGRWILEPNPSARFDPTKVVDPKELEFWEEFGSKELAIFALRWKNAEALLAALDALEKPEDQKGSGSTF